MKGYYTYELGYTRYVKPDAMLMDSIGDGSYWISLLRSLAEWFRAITEWIEYLAERYDW